MNKLRVILTAAFLTLFSTVAFAVDFVPIDEYPFKPISLNTPATGEAIEDFISMNWSGGMQAVGYVFSNVQAGKFYKITASATTAKGKYVGGSVYTIINGDPVTSYSDYKNLYGYGSATNSLAFAGSSVIGEDVYILINDGGDDAEGNYITEYTLTITEIEATPYEEYVYTPFSETVTGGASTKWGWVYDEYGYVWQQEGYVFENVDENKVYMVTAELRADKNQYFYGAFGISVDLDWGFGGYDFGGYGSATIHKVWAGSDIVDNKIYINTHDERGNVSGYTITVTEIQATAVYTFDRSGDNVTVRGGNLSNSNSYSTLADAVAAIKTDADGNDIVIYLFNIPLDNKTLTFDGDGWGHITLTGGTYQNTSGIDMIVIDDNISVTSYAYLNKYNSGDVIKNNSTGTVNIAGSLIRVQGSGMAINNVGSGTVNIDGGLIFGYGTSASNLVTDNAQTTITAPSVVIAWNIDAGNTEYNAGTSTDLNATSPISWANIAGESGITLNGTSLFWDMYSFIGEGYVTVNAVSSEVAVTSGTGGGSYEFSETVTITASTPATGMQFKGWNITPSVTFVEGTSASSQTAKFIMPAEVVTATATYEQISPIIARVPSTTQIAPNTTVKVYNMRGELISTSHSPLTTSQLTKGIYIVKTGNKTQKIVVK